MLGVGAFVLGLPAGGHHHNGEKNGDHTGRGHAAHHHSGKHKGDSSSGSSISMCDDSGNCFPRYYLLGAQKAGTTSVFQMLSAADLICGATANDPNSYKYKEAHFFDLNYVADASKYAALYPTSSKCDGSNFMDATPNYLFDHDVPTRMSELFKLMPSSLLPHMRMIAILREPISRDLSIYNMFKSQWMAEKVKTDTVDAGSVLRSLCKDGTTGFPTYHEAVKCMADEWHDKCKPGHENQDAYELCAYDKSNLAGGRRNRLTDGMYDAQLNRHGKGMPRSHLLVLQFEQMLDNQPKYIANLISFMGLPEHPELTEIPKDNTQAFPGKVETIRCDTLKALHGVFTPWNQQLYTRLEKEHSDGSAPADEPKFAQFTAPTCAEEEQINDGAAASKKKAAKPAALAPPQ